MNQSQSDTAPINHAGASPEPPSAWIQRSVVIRLPTSTTNMTGLRTMLRGFSFASESIKAWRTISDDIPDLDLVMGVVEVIVSS